MAPRGAESRRLVDTVAPFAVLAAVVLTAGSAGVLFAMGHSPARSAARVGPSAQAPALSPAPPPSASPEEASPSPSTSPTPPPIAGAYIVLSAPSPNVVWALIGNRYLYRSLDRGATWQQVHSPPGLGPNLYSEISFVSDSVGYALVPPDDCTQAAAQLFRTLDAGATWSPVSLPPVRCVGNVTFVDAAHGFASGAGQDYKAVVSRTSDGGRTWSQSTIPDPPGWVSSSRASLDIVPIKAFGNVVLAAGASNATVFHFRSSDSGATWTYLPTARDATPGYPNFLTPTHWLEFNSAEETTDAGQSWHSFDTDFASVVGLGARPVFATSDVGYCANLGSVYVTIDGGAHWTVVKTSWP